MVSAVRPMPLLVPIDPWLGNHIPLAMCTAPSKKKKKEKRKRNCFFCTGQNFFSKFPKDEKHQMKGTMKITAEEEQVLCLLGKPLYQV